MEVETGRGQADNDEEFGREGGSPLGRYPMTEATFKKIMHS